MTVSYVDFAPIGVLITNDNFVADTFDATTGTKAMREHAKKFWNATFSGETDKAYRLFIPEGKDKMFPRETFLEVIERAGIAANSKQHQLHPGPVRFSTSPEHNHKVHMEVFQMLERQDETRNPCRLRYQVENDQSFQMVTFNTGNFDDAWPINRFELQKKFYRRFQQATLTRC